MDEQSLFEAPRTLEYGALSIAGLLKSYQFRTNGQEAGLQQGIELVLRTHEIEFISQFDLGEHGRIDIYIPSLQLGIELKVKGAPSEVITQVHRYAQSPKINALILVTGKMRLAIPVTEINGKQVVNVVLWEAML